MTVATAGSGVAVGGAGVGVGTVGVGVAPKPNGALQAERAKNREARRRALSERSACDFCELLPWQRRGRLAGVPTAD